jgi:predicted exporter
MTPPSLKHPGRWIWLLLLIPVVGGVVRLRFDVEVFDLLPADLPVVKGLKLYQEYFANARQLIITVQASDGSQAEVTARQLAEALRVRHDLVSSATWEPPWLEQPGGMAEFLGYVWFNQVPSVFGQWTNRLQPQPLLAVMTAAREELATSLSPSELGRLSYDPVGFTQLPEEMPGANISLSQGQNLFASPDGRFRLIFVQANAELRSYRECQQWLDAVRSVAARAIITGGASVSLGYTGRPAFVAEAAGGMEHDMTYSVGGTAAIIAVLFWLAHRRVKPMLWLLVLLGIILGCTLALGGLIFGIINVVSVGFAAILLGLAVDYAVVHYQEALADPHLSIAQVRHAIAPAIFWAATTTIVAFLMLNLGGLPGLGQLGTLVGLGVGLAAFIMIFEFLPPLFPNRNEPFVPDEGRYVQQPNSLPAKHSPSRWLFVATVFVVCGPAIVLFWAGLPSVDPTANALRPRHSPAYTALAEVQKIMSQKREPLWVVVAGQTDRQVVDRLRTIQPVLDRAVSNGVLGGVTLPVSLWPNEGNQAANRETAAKLGQMLPVVRQTATAAGFTETSLALAKGVLASWQAASAASATFWPTNSVSRWILERFTARTSTNNFALGLIQPSSSAKPQALAQLQGELNAAQVTLSGWELLGYAIFSRVTANLWKVLVPMVLLVLASLFLAFRRPTEILLSLAILFLSGLCLLAIMRGLHWSWNLLNLMAVPLILGTGVDYSIFMQSALRRHGGDPVKAHAAVGRALLLCGGTAIAGFGSLAWSSNAGMASLGRVCAIGIGLNMLLSVFLLPHWWRAAVHGKDRSQPGFG